MAVSAQDIVEIEPPRTLLDLCRDAWMWRIHKHRIAVGIKKHFAPDRGEWWHNRPKFIRPITAIDYEHGVPVAYRDGEMKWWDFSD